MTPARARGFSLLEAIVAMVLIALVGMALFSWINASFVDLRRIQAVNAKSMAEMNALQFLQTINPMEQPVGQTELGALKLQWKSHAISEKRQNYTEALTPGPFSVALYETEVTLEEGSQVPRYSFVVKQMGWERGHFGDEAEAAAGASASAARTKPARP
jgi:general secretion pathway protein I